MGEIHKYCKNRNLVRVHPDCIEQVPPVEEDWTFLDIASIAIQQDQGSNIHLQIESHSTLLEVSPRREQDDRAEQLQQDEPGLAEDPCGCSVSSPLFLSADHSTKQSWERASLIQIGKMLAVEQLTSFKGRLLATEQRST